MRKKDIDFKTLLFLAFFLLILVFLDRRGYLQGTKSAFFSLSMPAQSRLYTSSNAIADFFETLEEIGDFKKENENLRKENRQLTFNLSKLEETERENEILKKQLKFKENLCGDTDCVDFQEGTVVSRDPDGYEESAIINLGSENNAQIGQAVTVASGIVIGKVSEVFQNYSRVVLLTSSQSSINCLTQTTRANGLAEGQYGTGVKLEMIDQSEDLLEGDLVITSGFEEKIPKGLILGRISGIKESPNVVFKNAGVELFSDFNKLEEIFLVTENE